MQETIVTNPQLNSMIWISFIGYLILVIGIGLYASRFSSRGISAYFIGGRSMNRFVVALSAVVSGRSAWLLLGFTGMAYKMGASAIWAGLGATLGPTSILALYWKRTTKTGVFAGIITGSVITVIWYFTPVLKFSMYELVPGFFAGLLTTIVISIFTRKPENIDEIMSALE